MCSNEFGMLERWSATERRLTALTMTPLNGVGTRIASGDQHANLAQQYHAQLGLRDTLPFDVRFRRNLHIPQFDPNLVEYPSSLEILGTLFSAPGITREQFLCVMRQCVKCHNVCYTERVEFHDCAGEKAYFWRSQPAEEVAEYLLSSTMNSGLTSSALHQQFLASRACQRLGGVSDDLEVPISNSHNPSEIGEPQYGETVPMSLSVAERESEETGLPSPPRVEGASSPQPVVISAPPQHVGKL
ncbi:hypothetical protein NMY22_g9485 [Coprinellus aureogranulatus]|nr:hypothetical protein NMY22_g9485 [Coprinellus aureogranulatus]